MPIGRSSRMTGSCVRLALDLPEDYLVSRIERRHQLLAPIARPPARPSRLKFAVMAAFRSHFTRSCGCPKTYRALSFPPILCPGLHLSGRHRARPHGLRAGPASSRTCSMCRNVAAATVDLSRLPFGPASRRCRLLGRHERALARRLPVTRAIQLTVDWPRDLLPHCLVWIHDRGIDVPPWNGSYRGIGIEPYGRGLRCAMGRLAWPKTRSPRLVFPPLLPCLRADPSSFIANCRSPRCEARQGNDAFPVWNSSSQSGRLAPDWPGDTGRKHPDLTWSDVYAV